MFTIKICGVTNVSDGLAVASAGGDAIGLNFYSRSLRFVDAGRASTICREMPETLAKVGVFVNADAVQIREMVELLDLDYVQLHGREEVAIAQHLEEMPFIKAFRINDLDFESLVETARRWLDGGAAAILLDAPQPAGEFGGSGQSGNWAACCEFVSQVGGRVILAGGLDPGNVQSAIAAVNPYGVDCASGVETFPGKKDASAITEFVQAAKAAFAKR